MNILKKVTFSILSVLLFANIFFINVNAQNFTFTSYNDLEGYRYMSLSGSGVMQDYDRILDCPGTVIPDWRSGQEPARYTHFLTIEEGITHIGTYAFWGMVNLQEAILPESLVSIGDYAFSSLPNTFNIHIPDSVTYISDSAFNNSNYVTIYCNTNSYAHKYACSKGIDFVLKDVVYLKGVRLDTDSVSLMKGNKFTLKATIVPSDVKNPVVTWKSSDTSIAAVSKKGVITGKKAGSATITVTVTAAAGDEEIVCKASCTVYVSEPAPKAKSISVTPSKKTLIKGEIYSLYAQIKPSNASGNITWKSSNKKVATVSKYGDVTAVGKGTATITASIKVGSKILKDTCTITVKNPTSVKDLEFKVSSKKLVYTQCYVAPKVTIKDGKYELVEGTDYYITYPTDNCSVGTQKIVINGINKYTGKKTITYTIVPAAPASTDIVLTKANAVKLSWSESFGADGYAVYYKKGSDSYKLLKRTTGTSIKKSGLAKGAKYTFKIVPYYYDKNDKECLSTKSKTASIYTLKAVGKVTVSKQSKKYVLISFKDINGESGYQISQSTSASKISVLGKYCENDICVKAAKNKTYYYRVRAYKYENGKYVYGPWSDPVKYTLK